MSTNKKIPRSKIDAIVVRVATREITPEQAAREMKVRVGTIHKWIADAATPFKVKAAPASSAKSTDGGAEAARAEALGDRSNASKTRGKPVPSTHDAPPPVSFGGPEVVAWSLSIVSGLTMVFGGLRRLRPSELQDLVSYTPDEKASLAPPAEAAAPLVRQMFEDNPNAALYGLAIPIAGMLFTRVLAIEELVKAKRSEARARTAPPQVTSPPVEVPPADAGLRENGMTPAPPSLSLVTIAP